MGEVLKENSLAQQFMLEKKIFWERLMWSRAQHEYIPCCLTRFTFVLPPLLRAKVGIWYFEYHEVRVQYPSPW